LDAAQQNGKMIRWPSKVLASKASENSCIIYLMRFTSISGNTSPQEEMNQTPRKWFPSIASHEEMYHDVSWCIPMARFLCRFPQRYGVMRTSADPNNLFWQSVSMYNYRAHTHIYWQIYRIVRVYFCSVYVYLQLLISSTYFTFTSFTIFIAGVLK
jgi:hypothetical protein